MIAFDYLFLVAGFTLGLALQHFLPTRRYDWRFWTIIGIITLGLYVSGQYLFPPGFNVGFLIALTVFIGFIWRWINPPLKRWVLPRFQPFMPYAFIGLVIILLSTFVSGNSFMASAITVGGLYAIFGGLWSLVTRLIK